MLVRVRDLQVGDRFKIGKVEYEVYEFTDLEIVFGILAKRKHTGKRKYVNKHDRRYGKNCMWKVELINPNSYVRGENILLLDSGAGEQEATKETSFQS